MIGEFSYLCKLEIITSVIELNPAHGVTGKPWWNSNRFKIRSYIIDNTTAFKITKVVKWKNSNDHMVALLLADVNRYADIYIIGRLSGVNILSKTSNVDTPQIDSSSSTLTVTLGAWSSALLICFESVTIS